MDASLKKWLQRGAVAVGMAIVAGFATVSAQEVERTLNPDLPERGVGRISARDFFARFPSHRLHLVSQCNIPDQNFGAYRPGERLSMSFMVAAYGERIGINHKTAPHPVYEMECSTPSKPPLVIRPDIGNT